MGFILVLWVILGAIVVVVIVMRQMATFREAWLAVANELDLEMEAPRFGQSRIHGSTDEFTVTVEMTGSGDNAQTRYRVDYPAQTKAFQIRRESGGQKILKAFGREDLEIGDQAFDDAFVVSAVDLDALKAWLNTPRRGSLLRLLSSHPGMLVTERSLQVTTVGVERNPQTVLATVRRMLDTGRHLLGRGPTKQLEEANELRTKGDLLAALKALDAAVAEKPDDIDTRLLRAETALSAGALETARRDLDEIEPSLGGDPEVRGLREVLDRPPPSPPSTDDVPDPDRMFQEIFGKGRLSFETDELFAERYKGRGVQLSGSVRSARPYVHDLDFGEGPGTKAVVTVAAITSDLYGNTAIDAVVALPPAMERDLERGRNVEITGTLARVDPMMRNVFLDNATVHV